MTFSYVIRLACLCLEIIFLVNLSVSIAVLALSPQVVRASSTMRPQRAARLFLTLRLLPFASSLGVVALLCIPSYLRYEQNIGNERIGWFCLLTAAFGLTLCLTSACKCIRALAQLYFVEQRCRLFPQVPYSPMTKTRLCLAEEDGSGTPLLALVGLFRPRLIVSACLLDALSAEQLEASLSHERAHQLSRDNLKRLLIAMAPGILPLTAGFGAIEQHWERCAELAADEDAAGGRIERAVALAEALTQVARLGNIERRIPLASSLNARNLDLAMRVDRLMAIDSTGAAQGRGSRFSGTSSLVFAFVAFAASLVLLPQALRPLHRLLESLLR